MPRGNRDQRSGPQASAPGANKRPGRHWQPAETGTDPRRHPRTGGARETGPTTASPPGTKIWGDTP
eukprot:9423443-Alexandrium_andersonii.AAC.1